MRAICREKVITVIENLCVLANTVVNQSTLDLIKKCELLEQSNLAKHILKNIIKNDELAEKRCQAICQDTGLVNVFVELGRNVYLNFDLEEAINIGVKNAYSSNYYRKSIVSPLSRINTNTNTPSFINITLNNTDILKFTILIKGAGSENMSVIKMLNPTTSVREIENIIVNIVKKNASKACPPLEIGIGLGGSFELAPLLAKKALFLNIDKSKEILQLEERLIVKLNKLGIGPMGLGGNTTILGVKILSHECHLASLPLAINFQCHVVRHRSEEI